MMILRTDLSTSAGVYQAHIAVKNSYLFQLHTGPKPPQNVEEIQTGIYILDSYHYLDLISIYIYIYIHNNILFEINSFFANFWG